ncbi:hypothetical protein BGX28_003848 [Mortierella sp. GBA30]|nr:hypothetical protein BGX28_003848 [Mortierella sp. GBA30]
MLVCKDWRQDFRRLLYRDLVLTGRTVGSIISPMQWRAYGSYTQSLAIEEPTLTHQGNKGNLKKGYKYSKGRDSQDNGTLRSPDYNLDSALHCPNLQNLTVRLNARHLPLCCWTRQDDEREPSDDGYLESTADQEPEQDKDMDPFQQPRSLFNTTVALRYGQKMDAYFVKTSNRVLALLHHHPRLQSFRWIGVSETHMDQIGLYILKRNPTRNPLQLVELQLERLRASVSELNRIILNCPRLHRLHLRTLILETKANWPELSAIFDSLGTAPLSCRSTQQSHEEQQLILDLRQIPSLTLAEPHFPLFQLFINGPNLESLELSSCQFPSGFSHAAATQSHHQGTNQTTLSGSLSSSSSAFSVSWICPKLKTFKHDQAPVLPSVFVHNLLESAPSTLRSLSLTSYTLEPTFVIDMVSNDHHCKSLTHLDLTNSTWIKSTDIQLLLCHCPELLEFLGPQGMLWGEDLLRSELSWSCVKLRRLRLLICLARPDSEMWERTLRDNPQSLGSGHEQRSVLGQSGAAPLFFPLQTILRVSSGDDSEQEELNTEAEDEGGDRDGVNEEDGPEGEEPTYEEKQRRPTSSTSNLIWLRDVQDAVLEQLSKLTRLESLDLSGGFKTFQFLVEYPRGIPWSLDEGLDRLRNLSQMRELVVTGWEDKMTRREVRWLKRHWPELRSIINKSGNLTDGVVKTGCIASSSKRAWSRKTKAGEDLVVGWLAFEICLAQEWPERFLAPE